MSVGGFTRSAELAGRPARAHCAAGCGRRPTAGGGARPGPAPALASLASSAARPGPHGGGRSGGQPRAHHRPTLTRSSPTDDASPTFSPSTPPSAPPASLPVRLNTTPTPRHVRSFFYEDAADGIDAALAAGEPRCAVRITLPETDRTFDSYRLATILECMRVSVMRQTARGKRVKVCVQGPLGEGFFTGMPLSLAGAGKMIAGMDWGRSAAAEAAVSFGDVSAKAVEDSGGAIDVFYVIAPQNMAGACVTAPLAAMAEAAGAAGAALILINPSLADVQSSGGLMSVRGRADRLGFEASFVPAYTFRLLFANPTIPYPILGALRHRYGEQWQVWSREEAAAHVEGREQYVLVGETGAEPPEPPELTSLLRNRRLVVERMEREAVAAARRLEKREQGGGEKRAWWEWW